MSKAQALSMLSGQPVTTDVKPGLITPDVNPAGLPTDPPATEAPTKDELQSSRLAIMAKKEAAIQKEREAIKKEREDLLKEKQEADAYRNKGKEFDELFAKNKREALKKLGLTDTDIVNILSEAESQAEPTAEEVARKVAAEESQKVRDEIAAEKVSLQNERNQMLVNNLKASIKETIKTQADKYQFCDFEGESAEAEVYGIIVKELKDSGNKTLLTVPEALDIYEELLETQDKERRAKIKKLQAEAGAPTATKEGKPLASNAAPKTLTNQVAPTTAAAAAPRSETKEQKRERLINALTAMGKA